MQLTIKDKTNFNDVMTCAVSPYIFTNVDTDIGVVIYPQCGRLWGQDLITK
jgi:hypothetical protein